MTLAKIRYQIVPKEIDDNDNEEELGQYLEATDVTLSSKFEATLSDAQKEITLPNNAESNVLSIEFISDQPVDFKIYDSLGTTLQIQFTDCQNLLLKAKLNDYVYKIISNSGQDTHVQWRLYS